LPPTITAKRRTALKPISYDELMGNAGMSGFVAFLEPPREAETAAPGSRRKGRIRRAVMVEDGHSLAEQAVYEALWKAASPLADEPGSEERTVRIGYHRLAKMTRLSWVSVKTNLRSLEKKLAIEVTASENSATREGKCYRVYSRSAILQRREKDGLVWVRRSRGVELLRQEQGLR